MPVIQQTLDSVKFVSLKGLKNVEINFSDKPITAIFGVNGCGKSTILHALACLYKPIAEGGEKNYFTRFFKKENGVSWKGSKLEAFFTINGRNVNKTYGKGGDRWTPRMNNRPGRYVAYIGINTCVPAIEQEIITLTNFKMGDIEDVTQKDKIITSASKIMNYSYNDYGKVSYRKKKYKKVSKGAVKYSSLAMGAGEQRLFTILEILYSMPAYSLLLIDELDLTLHTSALNNLLDEMIKVAENKYLQIVFTTHREEIAAKTNINIRHIWKATEDNQTFVLDHTTPECLHRLTGRMEKQLEIYVEDDLAEAIAKQVVRDKEMLPYISFHQFGAIENAFVVAAGCDIQEQDSDNKIFILDGDGYTTHDKRLERMNRIYSGNEQDKEERRNRALSHIKQFILPSEEQPEHFLWEKLKETEGEYAQYAKEIQAVGTDKHAYLNGVQKRCGESREIFLYKVIDILSKQDFWNDYVMELSTWLDERKETLRLE